MLCGVVSVPTTPQNTVDRSLGGAPRDRGGRTGEAAGAMDGCPSVIIPARNASASLAACLSGVAANRAELPPREVIVVDDGSTDDTAAIARAHGARVVHAAGRGP